MSSIETAAVFKATIGLLVENGQNIDDFAEKLKDGDVTDQKFHSLIVREINNFRSPLDALSKEDLVTSISLFEQGMASLLKVFERTKSTSECGAAIGEAACDGRDEAFSPIKGISRLELTDLDQSAKRELSAAKRKFEDAQRKATEAFKNEDLKISDRILAMKYRVMATILKTIDNPAHAVASCKKCVEELNCLPAVQNAFAAKLKKDFRAVRGLLSKGKRREIISGVCLVNHVI